jgi:hypothetical protein
VPVEWTCNSLNWLLKPLKLCVSISLLWYRMLEFIVLILLQIKKGFCAHNFLRSSGIVPMLHYLNGTSHYVDKVEVREMGFVILSLFNETY